MTARFTVLHAFFPQIPVPTKPVICQPKTIAWVIENGLGPIAYHALQENRIKVDSNGARDLQSADITARVMTDYCRGELEEVLLELNKAEIEPILLKGISIASRYPQPHWRLMSDVDLLVRHDQLEATVAALRGLGFVNGNQQPEKHWLHHHHAAPLYHHQRKLWIEVHHALLSDPYLNRPALAIDAIWSLKRRNVDFTARTFRLPPQLELNYLAAHWYLNLIEDLGTAGLQRTLFDAAFLLKDSAVNLDWSLSDQRLAFATLTLLVTLNDLGAISLSEKDKQAWIDTHHLDSSVTSFAVRSIHQQVTSQNTSTRATLQRIHGSWFELALTNKRAHWFRLRRWVKVLNICTQAVRQKIHADCIL